MNYRMKDRLLPIIFLAIFSGSLLFIASPGWSWETKVPELAKAQAELLGFKTKDKVGKVAPEIKLGMVIDSSNYEQHPDIKKLLPKSLYDRFHPDVYAPLAPIKIAKTDQYHCSWGWVQNSKKSAKTIRIGEDGLTLEGYVGGYPFIHPKNGVELVQWADNTYIGDTFAMRPMRLRLYGRDNKPERELRQFLNVIRYMSCNDWRMEGIQPNPEEINYVVSGTFTYPRDISGTSYVRKRYLPADKPDEFILYIASMRRIRRMSGRDTQDPLFGSDVIWDDYDVFWQKLSTVDFPNEYKMQPAREMLVPTLVDYDWPDDRDTAGLTDYKIDESGDQTYLHFGSWQRRWVYVLEITSKDSYYLYSRRTVINDPETCMQPQADYYDQAGRLWRTWVRDINLARDGTGGRMEDLIDIVDHVNQHRTILDFKGHKGPQWMGTDYADVRFLSRKAK